MITLYRVADCDACDEVQNALRELVVAHQVVDVEKELAGEVVNAGKPPTRPAALAERLSAGDWPVVDDGDQVISGAAALRGYLAALTLEMEAWRKFQTDACYIDDKGKSC